MRRKSVFQDRIAVSTDGLRNLTIEESSTESSGEMLKERRLSESRFVRVVRRPSDTHPMGGIKLGRFVDSFIFGIVKNSSADAAGLLVGDLVEEVNGVPCRDFKLPDLELVIAGLLQEGGVWLKVRSDHRLRLRDERGDALRGLSQTRGIKSGDRPRRNLFPTVHPNQNSDIQTESSDAEVVTPHRRTAPRKYNMDKETAPNERISASINISVQVSDPPPLKNAATNTEFVCSYFISARAYREWLRTQRKADCREPGNFSKNVKIYNSMMRTTGKSKGKERRDEKNRQQQEPAPQKKSSRTPDLTKYDSKGTSPPSHKKVLGAALSSVGRLLNSRRGSRRTSK